MFKMFKMFKKFKKNQMIQKKSNDFDFLIFF